MKPYGWKPRANEYVGRCVEWLERVVSRRWGRRANRQEVEDQRNEDDSTDAGPETH